MTKKKYFSEKVLIDSCCRCDFVKSEDVNDAASGIVCVETTREIHRVSFCCNAPGSNTDLPTCTSGDNNNECEIFDSAE